MTRPVPMRGGGLAGAGSALSVASLSVGGFTVAGANAFGVPADHGFKAWTFPPDVGPNATALSPAGTLFLRRIRRVPAGALTGAVIFVTTAGSTLTAGQCFASVFTAAGALIGTSADQSGTWNSAGLKLMPLVGGPFTLPAIADLYVGVWYNGTTGPTLARAGLNGPYTNANLAAPNFIAATSTTGLTTTPPDPFGAQLAGTNSFWAGVY